MRFVVVQASETVGTEDRTIEAAQHMETACKLMVRVKQYDRAADALHQTLQLYSEGGAGAAAGRVVLAFILVQVLTDVHWYSVHCIFCSHPPSKESKAL